MFRITASAAAAVAAVMAAGGLVWAASDSFGSEEQWCRTKAGYLRMSSTGECRRSEVPVDLPQGPQGEQGIQGERGEQGEQGASAAADDIAAGLIANASRCQPSSFGSQAINLSSCSLRNAWFAGSTIDSGDFSKADLSGANFTNAQLNDVNFDGANLSGADFRGARIGGVTMLRGANLDGADFRGVRWSLVEPSHVDLSGATLDPGASFSLVDIAPLSDKVIATIDGYDAAYEWTVASDAGSASMSGSRVTVSGLYPGQAAVVTVTARKFGSVVTSSTVEAAAAGSGATCANGEAACAYGDTGPHGGVVITVVRNGLHGAEWSNADVSDYTYMWTNYGGMHFQVQSWTMPYSAALRFQSGSWRIPTALELSSAWTNVDRKQGLLGLSGESYWTSTATTDGNPRTLVTWTFGQFGGQGSADRSSGDNIARTRLVADF